MLRAPNDFSNLEHMLRYARRLVSERGFTVQRFCWLGHQDCADGATRATLRGVDIVGNEDTGLGWHELRGPVFNDNGWNLDPMMDDLDAVTSARAAVCGQAASNVATACR